MTDQHGKRYLALRRDSQATWSGQQQAALATARAEYRRASWEKYRQKGR